jgi:hypothetical protein
MGRQREGEGRRESGRSPVVLGPAVEDAYPHAHYSRPTAAFLAHLIATALQAPQTRQRRRAEPQDAAVLYATAAAYAESGGKYRSSI